MKEGSLNFDDVFSSLSDHKESGEIRLGVTEVAKWNEVIWDFRETLFGYHVR